MDSQPHLIRRPRTAALRAVRTVLVVAGLAVGTTPAPADDATLAPVNYAFSHALGSGIYEVGGRLVHSYTVSPAVSLLTRETTRLRLKIRATLGLVNLRSSDVLDTRFPDDLASLSLIPTLTLERTVSSVWRLAPFAGAGAGKDLSTGAVSWIYTVGAESLIRLEGTRHVMLVGNRVFYTGYTDRRVRFVDDYSALETGAEVRRRLGVRIAKEEVDAGVFAVATVHIVSPGLVTLPLDAVEMRSSWEAGVTVGAADPAARILNVTVPRLGVSYRFGKGTNAVRVVLGKPF